MQLVLPKGKVEQPPPGPFSNPQQVYPIVYNSKAMDVQVNQQIYSVSETCSLQDLLDTVLKQPSTGIAIALNQQIISKARWPEQQLQAGDTITLISATQGG